MRSDELGAGQLPKDFRQFPPVSGVQGSRGFIQQQKLRFPGQKAGNGGELFLSSGKPVDLPPGQPFHPHFFQGFRRAPGCFFPWHSGIPQAKGYIAFHRRQEQLAFRILEHVPGLFPDFRKIFPVHGEAAYLHVPFLEGQKPDDQFQQGGLPHPVAADKPHFFSRRQSKGQILEYGNRWFFRPRQDIAEPDMGQGKNGRHGQDSFRSSIR